MKKDEKKEKVTEEELNKIKVKKKAKNRKRSKAFTLIELLAVIIILGVLMIIAIPSVTSYISESRKSSYATTAQNIVSGARTLVNSGKLSLYDVGSTYYVPYDMVSTENGTSTPYGEFENAYVIVTYDGDGFDYYFAGVDTSHMGIDITPYEDIKSDKIKSDVEVINTDVSICGKPNVIVYSKDGTVAEDKKVLNCYDVNTKKVEEFKLIKTVYQETEGELNPGDEICINNSQNFFVVSTDGDRTTLLAKYNLYVGDLFKNENDTLIYDRTISPSEKGYGLQSSEALGYTRYYLGTVGVVPFSSSTYWLDENRKVLPKYGGEPGRWPMNSYIYDSELDDNPYIPVNCEDSKCYPAAGYTIAYYVNLYRQKVEEMGVEVFDARIISSSELAALGCDTGHTGICRYYSAKPFTYLTSYWSGSLFAPEQLRPVEAQNNTYSLHTYNLSDKYGVRPIIVIKTSDISLLNHEYFVQREEERQNRFR